MSHHIVEFKNVSFRYPNKTEALRDISFRITHGESVGIIGANGAGKTTIFNLITGVYQLSEGTILYYGQPLTAEQYDTLMAGALPAK